MAVAFAPEVAFRVATISTLITLAVSLIIASDFGHWYDDGFGLVTELAWLPSIGASFDMHADARHVACAAFDGLDAHLCDRVQDRHQRTRPRVLRVALGAGSRHAWVSWPRTCCSSTWLSNSLWCRCTS